MSGRHMLNLLAKTTVVLGAAGGAGLYYLHNTVNSASHVPKRIKMEEISVNSIPSRESMIRRLKASTMEDSKAIKDENSAENPEDMYDILVIGGGATGTGIALDAISRGLKVALVERDDFASGTSSRSTKLIHGGVRYLEKAFTKLDAGQLHLVQDALRERRHLINIAPHLSRPLPIIVPLYNSFPSILFYAPYYYMGVKAYDFFAGQDGVLEPSYWIGYKEAREKFPMLNQQGLKGGVVYFDGQHDDARMCLGIALTAAAKGAVLANHVEVTALSMDDAAGARVNGAMVKDNLSGESFHIRSKMVVNATGPFCDAVRGMTVKNGQPKPEDMISPSSGVHVVLSGQYSPEGMGLIIPETSDGRVIFLLPWEGSTVIGTTDSKCGISALPRPYEHEIQFILKETSHFLKHEIKREDVDAAWSGIRPLAKDVHAKDTASASRDHIIETKTPGMITIAGGKWTTYRKMAEDAVDMVLKLNTSLKSEAAKNTSLSKYVIDTSKIGPSKTLGVPLIGAAGWSLQLPTTLHRLGFEQDIADHLSHSYGDKALDISKIVAREKNLAKRLHAGYPFIEAEIVFSARHEYAFTVTDMIANRIRLGFLNSDVAIHALPKVISLMARELGWDTSRKIIEYQNASKFLSTMNRKGKNPLAHSDPLKLEQTEARLRQVFDYVPFSDTEISSLRRAFNDLDTDEDGHLSREDIVKLINSTEAFGLSNLKLTLQDSTTSQETREGIERASNKFLEQLDLLDKDDSISWDPFLFAMANAFHSRSNSRLAAARMNRSKAPEDVQTLQMTKVAEEKQDARQAEKEQREQEKQQEGE